MTEGGRRSRHPLILAAAAALATLMLAATGCGGGSSGDAAAAADADDKALRWAACMRKNCADVPDPKVDENGRLVIDGTTEQQQQRSAAYAKAFAACEDLFAEIRPPGASNMSAKERERFLAGALRYARCMRKHGIAISDPSLTRESAAVSLPDNVDPSSPAFKKAEAACGRLTDATSGS